jgi:hypothetical protein
MRRQAAHFLVKQTGSDIRSAHVDADDILLHCNFLRRKNRTHDIFMVQYYTRFPGGFQVKLRKRLETRRRKAKARSLAPGEGGMAVARLADGKEAEARRRSRPGGAGVKNAGGGADFSKNALTNQVR